jgi:recombination protein RecA
VGQGRENSKQFLLDHPELLAEIDRRVREHYNLDPDGAKIPAPAAEDSAEDKE